ncbi:hypothetical protein C8R44DRAFT_256328 [Mycena epipterygia]|nr:hypothetical protein C8R44DRAFT_256328 [Mycena epipterygia]
MSEGGSFRGNLHSPDSSYNSPFLESPGSPVYHNLPFSPGYHNSPFLLPQLDFSPIHATREMLSALTFGDHEFSPLGSRHSEYPFHPNTNPESDAHPGLSPLCSTTGLPEFESEPGIPSSGLSREHDDYGSETSLLFKTAPLQHLDLEAHPSSHELRGSTSSRTRSGIWAATPSGNDLLTVPSLRRHSFSAPRPEGTLFLTYEGSASTPDTPSSPLPSSPHTSETTSEFEIVNPLVGSPAGVLAAKRRRKKPAIFHCDRCPASFTALHNLKNHLNAHAGFKPHVCNLCRARFTTLSVAKRHMKTCQTRPQASGSARPIFLDCTLSFFLVYVNTD